MEVFKAAILKICLLFAVVLVFGNASETLLDDEEPIESSQNCSDLLHTYLENLLDSKFSIAITDIEAKCLVSVQDQLLVSRALNNLIESKVTSKVNEVLAPILVQLQAKMTELDNAKTSLSQEVNTKLVEVDTKLMEVDTKMESKVENVNVEDLEGVQVLKELGKLKPMKNCQELQDQGVSTSGSYYIDADGDGLGQKPFAAQCDFEGNATTILRHDLVPLVVESNVQVELNYQVPKDQMKSLIKQSKECYQNVKFDCFNAPLIKNEESMAQIKNLREYWSGLEEEICEVECGFAGCLFSKTITCNCDDPEGQSDQKRVTRSSLLPITGFRYGRMSTNGNANITIGPLVCSGQSLPRKVVFAAVRTRNNLRSGPDTEVITYDTLTVNIGNSMDIESGTFSTPVQGLYRFSVSYGDDRGGPERFFVKKNGDHIFDFVGASYSWMFSLEKDDTITLHNEANLDLGRTGPGNRGTGPGNRGDVMHLYFTGQLI